MFNLHTNVQISNVHQRYIIVWWFDIDFELVEIEQAYRIENRRIGILVFRFFSFFCVLSNLFQIQYNISKLKHGEWKKRYFVEYKKGVVEIKVKMEIKVTILGQQVQVGNAKMRKCKSEHLILFSELKDIVCEWIADRKARG